MRSQATKKRIGLALAMLAGMIFGAGALLAEGEPPAAPAAPPVAEPAAPPVAPVEPPAVPPAAAPIAKVLPARLLWEGAAPGAVGEAPADKPTITPYLVEGDGPFAAVVVCPGGGYGGHAEHEGKPIAEWLNAAGVSAFVLQYRVAPYKHPVPLGDAQRAIRLVRSCAGEWRIDPSRIGILGFSAGGHLAVSAATIFDGGYPEAADPVDKQSCKPNALIACYPVISFGEYRHQGSMVNLLGENPEEELRNSMSLENRVTKDTCPSFLWHTAEDAGVPVENSLLLALALSKNKVPFELHVFPHGAHGLGLAKDHPEAKAWPGLCVQWLRGLGFVTK